MQIPLLLVKYYNSNKATLEKQYHSTTTQIPLLLVQYYSSNEASFEKQLFCSFSLNQSTLHSAHSNGDGVYSVRWTLGTVEHSSSSSRPWTPRVAASNHGYDSYQPDLLRLRLLLLVVRWFFPAILHPGPCTDQQVDQAHLSHLFSPLPPFSTIQHKIVLQSTVPNISPWYNRNGWPGVKHQVTYLSLIHL